MTNAPLLSQRLNRRAVLRAGGAASLCALPLVWAQSTPGTRLVVNEAVTADLSISMLAVRYRGWAEYIAPVLRTR